MAKRRCDGTGVVTAVQLALQIALIGLVAMHVASDVAQADDGKLIFVPGKTVGLIPPAGFVVADDFSGLRNPTSSGTILVIEYPAKLYPHVKAGMQSGSAVPKGLDVGSVKPMRVGETDGMVLRGKQTISGKATKTWILVIGGPQATAIITVNEPKTGTLNDKTVSKMFAGIRLRKPPSLNDQLARLPFAFGSLAGFKIWRTSMGAMAMLSKAPKAPPNPKTNPMLVVISQRCNLPEGTNAKSLAEFALRAERGVAFKAIGPARGVSVGGGEGYEVIVSGTDRRSQTPVRANLWFRLQNGRLLTAMSFIDAETDDGVLADMRQVVANLKAK